MAKQNNVLSNFESNNTYNTREIKNAATKVISSEGLEEFLKAASSALSKIKISKWVAIISLVLGFANSLIWIITIIAIGFYFYIRKTGVIELSFGDQEDKPSECSEFNRIVNITESKKTWRITQTSNVKDKKYTAGAGNLVKREKCVASKSAPFPFKTEYSCATFKSPKETLLFLPSIMIVIQGTKVGAVNYSDLSLAISNSTFVETETVPSDTEIIGYTWKYVNKSGGPDSRFKNNKKLPVCNYGNITVQSNQGIDTVIKYSNPNL